MTSRSRVGLPGLPTSLLVTTFGLSLFVILPLSAVVLVGTTQSPRQFWHAVADPRTLAAYRLSFSTAFASAAVTAIVGVVIAWVLVRYVFPGRRLLDATIDIPFALPTAVSGIALAALYVRTGLIGRWFPVPIAYTPLGITLALIFLGLPFVVRAVQPVLAQTDRSLEEASASLGASRWQTFARVVLPQLLPALLTGTTLAFARALGEYGSVVFVAGNMPFHTEIAPLLIMTRLTEFDAAGAAAIAAVLLLGSLVALVILNQFQRWSAESTGRLGATV